MKLTDVLQGVQVQGAFADQEITNVCSDSRNVEPGCLYVCIKGLHFDAHTVAQNMLDSGAAAVLVERDLGLPGQILVENTRSAWGIACANFFGNPSEKLTLIGITGTNGKTTTTFLIKQILESLGKKVGLIGTVKNMVADESLPAKYTTPDAYELQGLFRRMVDAGCEYCVMEVSSQALAQDRVNGCNFTVAAFTNLTQDHLDYHQTWDNYFAAKRKLFTMCQTAIMNVDDDNALPLVEGLDCKVIRYAVKNDDSDYTAKNLRLSADRIAYELVSVNGIGRVICPIPGRFSVYNSLCAAVCVLTLGFDYSQVLEGLRQTSGVKGRIEVVPTDTDYTVLIDYAHSPDGLQNIISSLREVSQGRIVTVFGCGGDRDRTKRPEMGRIAAQLSDYCVVTSDNPRTEDPDAIIADILEGVRQEKTPYTTITSRRDAIRYALEHAKTDDMILLAGKGHETYQVLKDETIHFDEREIVREILNG